MIQKLCINNGLADKTTLIFDSTSYHHLINMIVQLTHSHQAPILRKDNQNYFQSRKENHDDNSMIFLGDFEEKLYTLVIHDEIQYYHW